LRWKNKNGNVLMSGKPSNRRRFLGQALGATGLLLLPPAVGQGRAAEPYPARPVRIIVPYPPGGTTDIVARIIAQQLGEALGRPFVVDNRAGASGAIGASAVAKSPPDGYTLLMGTANSHGINSALQTNLSYDAVKDFAPITVVASTPNVVIVNAKLPVRSLADLVTLAKADPGKLNYGSTSPGGSPHMSAELLQAMTGTRMTHVPYKGAAPMLTDLVAGTIQVGFDNLPSSMGMIQSGDVRALAVTTPERWPGTPDLPTVAESGVPEYEVSGWFGLLAPAGTPAAIVDRIQTTVAEAVRKPGVGEQFAAAGAKPVANRPDVFARQIAADVERWKKVVETTGVRLE
jgi:tripartite-type tricarboxylate transporter receptor subunit TctC